MSYFGHTDARTEDLDLTTLSGLHVTRVGLETCPGSLFLRLPLWLLGKNPTTHESILGKLNCVNGRW